MISGVTGSAFVSYGCNNVQVIPSLYSKSCEVGNLGPNLDADPTCAGAAGPTSSSFSSRSKSGIAVDPVGMGPRSFNAACWSAFCLVLGSYHPSAKSLFHQISQNCYSVRGVTEG